MIDPGAEGYAGDDGNVKIQLPSSSVNHARYDALLSIERLVMVPMNVQCHHLLSGRHPSC